MLSLYELPVGALQEALHGEVLDKETICCTRGKAGWQLQVTCRAAINLSDIVFLQAAFR